MYAGKRQSEQTDVTLGCSSSDFSGWPWLNVDWKWCNFSAGRERGADGECPEAERPSAIKTVGELEEKNTHRFLFFLQTHTQQRALLLQLFLLDGKFRLCSDSLQSFYTFKKALQNFSTELKQTWVSLTWKTWSQLILKTSITMNTNITTCRTNIQVRNNAFSMLIYVCVILLVVLYLTWWQLCFTIATASFD